MNEWASIKTVNYPYATCHVVTRSPALLIWFVPVSNEELSWRKKNLAALESLISILSFVSNGENKIYVFAETFY